MDMPPRHQFTRDQVLEAAFQIYRREGPDAVTARRIARELGSSVGPIYSFFGNLDDLQTTLKERALLMMEGYSRKEFTDMPFLNMGVGFILFARDEPVLFRESYLKGLMGSDPMRPGPGTIRRMKEDPMTSDLPDPELADLYVRLSFLTFGIAVMVSNGQIPDPSEEVITGLLYRAGGDLIIMARSRTLSKGPGGIGEAIEVMRRYLDEHNH